MSYDIPPKYERNIQKIADSLHISADEALEQVIEAGLQRIDPQTQPPEVDASEVSYASLFGSVKGPGAHGSKEAIDKYIDELRSEW